MWLLTVSEFRGEANDWRRRALTVSPFFRRCLDLQFPPRPPRSARKGHGVLNRAKIPTFEGEELYKGTIMHTSKFDRTVPLEGKRVAVIGNGSSGVSF